MKRGEDVGYQPGLCIVAANGSSFSDQHINRFVRSEDGQNYVDCE